jgi:hypothetical protein
MPISHTNRKGQVYYLHEGKTKTGKPRYYFSKEQGDNLANAVPEGYEVYEKPSAQVFLRKAVPTKVTPQEVEIVKEGLRSAGVRFFLVEVEKDSIVVHAPSQSRSELEEIAEELGGGLLRAISNRMLDERQRRGPYVPMLRFVLGDEQQRRFSAQRWCFRGGMEGWMSLMASGDLAALVADLAPHLDDESFFELM